MGDVGLKLREWAANDPELKEGTQNQCDLDSRSAIAVLGLRWDTLTVAPKEFELVTPTKTANLRVLAAQNDPIGLITPINIKVKFLIQEIEHPKVS